MSPILLLLVRTKRGRYIRKHRRSCQSNNPTIQRLPYLLLYICCLAKPKNRWLHGAILCIYLYAYYCASDIHVGCLLTGMFDFTPVQPSSGLKFQENWFVVNHLLSKWDECCAGIVLYLWAYYVL